MSQETVSLRCQLSSSVDRLSPQAAVDYGQAEAGLIAKKQNSCSSLYLLRAIGSAYTKGRALSVF